LFPLNSPVQRLTPVWLAANVQEHFVASEQPSHDLKAVDPLAIANLPQFDAVWGDLVPLDVLGAIVDNQGFDSRQKPKRRSY
jgi:hypothetical protein